MKTLLQALRLVVVLSLCTGVLYPLAVWPTARIFFRHEAEGSLIVRDNVIVGSALIAQKNEDPRYFQPRPSAGDFATVASGASNLAWSSAKLHDAVAGRTVGYVEQNHLAAGRPLPADAITTSGSGLDPHLSPGAVQLQVQRVADARGLTPAQRKSLDELIAHVVEGGQFGPARINVLRLNLALDDAFPRQ